MRYLEIREIPIPYVQVQVAKERWTEAETDAGQCLRAEPMRLNTGSVLLEMLVRPVAMGQGGPQAAANDYPKQRAARNAIKALDADGDGVCDQPLGTWLGLEDAWYELIMEQAKIWPWSFRAPEIADLIEAWENAPSEKPFTIDEPAKNGRHLKAVDEIPEPVSV